MEKQYLKLMSRAGKSSTQRFSVIKKTSSIINREHKTKKVDSVYLSGVKGLQVKLKPEDVRRQVEEEWKKFQLSSGEGLKEQKSQASPVFMSQSREAFYESLKSKDRIPPTGHYNINYRSVERNSGSLKILAPRMQKIKSQSLGATPVESPNSRQLETFIRQNSPVNFAKMLKREMYTSKLPGPHEKRFEMFNDAPRISTRYKQGLHRRLTCPNFDQFLPRDDRLYRGPDYQPVYNPDKEYTAKNLGKVPDFQKSPGRPPLFKIPYSPAPYPKSYRLTEQRNPEVQFPKSTNNSHHPSLPSYMQNIYKRTSLGQITAKTIEMNSFSNSKLPEARHSVDNLHRRSAFTNATLSRNISEILIDEYQCNLLNALKLSSEISPIPLKAQPSNLQYFIE